MLFLVNVGVVAAVYVVVGYLERRPELRYRVLSAPRRFLVTDLVWYGLAVAATAISVFLLQPLLARLTLDPIAGWVDGLPLAVQLAGGVVVFDFVSFLVHRQLHRSDVLWSFHKVHHSSLELDGLATARAHTVENLVRFVPGQLVLFALGVPAPVVASTVGLVALYGISNHSNLDIRAPWLERVLVTPRLHRRHHVPSSTRRNYGTVLTIWDRLFGTLERTDTSDVDRYGVPGEIDTYPQRFAGALRRPFSDARGRRRTGPPAANDQTSPTRPADKAAAA